MWVGLSSRVFSHIKIVVRFVGALVRHLAELRAVPLEGRTVEEAGAELGRDFAAGWEDGEPFRYCPRRPSAHRSRDLGR